MNNNPTTGAFAIYILLSTLITAGWTKPKDSDGTTYSSSGTQLTGGGTGANGLGNTDAWFVVKDPGGGRSFCFQRGTTNYNWRIKYSFAAGFSGGSPSATQVPSATDEVILLGGGTDSSPSFSQLLDTTDGAYRFSVAAGDSSVGYSWYFISWVAGNPSGTIWAMMLDVLVSGSYPASDVDPSVTYIPGNGSGSINSFARLDMYPHGPLNGFLNNSGSNDYQELAIISLYDYINGMYGQADTSSNGYGVNTWSTKDDMTPVGYGRHHASGAPFGFKGYGSLMKFAMTFRANGDTLSVASTGAKDYIFINGAALPWDGSNPSI